MSAFYLRVWLLRGASILAALPLSAQDVEPRNLDIVSIYKIINTLIFAAGLGYLIAKSAPKFFNARSAEIQKAIQDASGLKIEAEFRSSEIDRKMATLAEEVKTLREQSAAAMTREHERLRRDTADETKRILTHAHVEIQALREEGEQQVRRDAVGLALQAAEARLRSQLGSGSAGYEQDALLQDFIHLVESGRN